MPFTLEKTFMLPTFCWKRAPAFNINEARQYFSFDASKFKWKGVSDLSGTVQFTDPTSTNYLRRFYRLVMP